ncbi:C3HC4 type (RING finger) zinc finger containing protein [Cladophialophora carrionii]|uniref:C3HC4 type (RING finger) zinc finger containing protein n=1 Tax=Cladophialophora carrionii TaxID=86049 RepID=A0A1C1CLH1_9EURO|nr:C3HC4 type (RING finger) zinc finger containing protein [Cladophialophora carrionii]
MATSTATVGAATPTASSSNNGGSGPSSPLLFFVALGFGVVFTNLWIIVGVKYCFRYNQRNRARMNGEDPDAVDLTAMPRQHRRRREKKLMTIDEVNEKFPLIQYKAWRSNRADEGLPTAGGINTSSRPASVHNVQRDSKDSKEMDARDLAPMPTNTTDEEKMAGHGTPEVVGGEKSTSDNPPGTPVRPKSAQSTVAPETPLQKVATEDEDEDEEERIQTAIPAEQLPDPGDACAICIDTIDDDDDIRGLTCGHAFHASCVDPWLTSRRACCPLCKADYYVPKPRPEGADINPANIQPPPTAFSIIGGGRAGRRPAMIIPGRFMSIVYHDRDRHGFPLVVRAERRGQPEQEQARRQRGERLASSRTATVQDGAEIQPQSWRSRFGLRIPGRSRQAEPPQPTPEAQPTPSQLEAGR